MSSVTSAGEALKLFPQTRWSQELAAPRKNAPESAVALEAIQ